MSYLDVRDRAANLAWTRSLFPLHPDLADLPQTPETDDERGGCEGETEPECSSIALHQRWWAMLVRILRLHGNTAGDDGGEGETDTLPNLCDSVEHSAGQCLGFVWEGGGNDEVRDREESVRPDGIQCHGWKDVLPIRSADFHDRDEKG